MSAAIHLIGGGVLELQLEAADPREAAEGLRRDRALMGRICADQAGEFAGCEVLVPANRVHMVCWS